MKVLFVDLEYDYGVKSRGINAIGHDGFKKSFERLGHEVVPFYYDGYLDEKDELQEKLCNFADVTKPDLIFFCLFRDQFTLATLEYLKSKYKTINWFGDDQWRFDSFTKVYANSFTWCISTDKYAISKYHAIGQKNVIYSQWAAINEHKINAWIHEYKYDVSFVGGYHPYRKWLITQLEKQGVSVAVFGNGWPNGPLKSEEMNQLFLESKINLNISNSNCLDLRYLTFSIRAFMNGIRSPKSASQIKARNFEIPYFGGFQLTDYVPSLEGYFEIGKEVVCYSDSSEVVLQIKYYLENNEEREAIRKAGFQKAVSEHGYINRFSRILEKIL